MLQNSHWYKAAMADGPTFLWLYHLLAAQGGWDMGGRIFATKGRSIVATTVHKFKCKSLPHMQLEYMYICACIWHVACICEHKWFYLIVEALFGSRKLKFICKSFGNLWHSHSYSTYTIRLLTLKWSQSTLSHMVLKIILVRWYVYL